MQLRKCLSRSAGPIIGCKNVSERPIELSQSNLSVNRTKIRRFGCLTSTRPSNIFVYAKYSTTSNVGL